MKNKIITCVILSAVLLFVSVASALAQAKSTFAGDVNINPASGKEYGMARVAVAYNGDVYVGRMLRNPGEEFMEWEILKSEDGGTTFTYVGGSDITVANTHYTAFDIVACGNSASEFKLYVSRASINIGTGFAGLSVSTFNGSGFQGGVNLDESQYTHLGNRGWTSISMSTDTKDPGLGTTPYDIAIAAAKGGANDSVIIWTSNGGTNFTRRGLAATTGYIKNVSCANGTADGFPHGIAGVVWDIYPDNLAEFGNIKAYFVKADNAADVANSGPYDVGNTNNEYRRPVLTMSNENGYTEIKGGITYEHDGTTSGTGVDIYTRTFDQLIQAAPQITSATPALAVANSTSDEINPHAAYNAVDDKFLFTYYNAGNDALVYKSSDISTVTTNAPAIAQLNYRDNQDPVTEPMPRVDGRTAARNFFVWNDQFNTFIDLEIKWPASVQKTAMSVSEMKLYPNPATDNITLNFMAEENDKASVSVIDMSGRILQNTEATITKGSNKLQITLNLPAGNYTLRISGEHTNTAVMFTVQR